MSVPFTVYESALRKILEASPGLFVDNEIDGGRRVVLDETRVVLTPTEAQVVRDIFRGEG